MLASERHGTLHGVAEVSPDALAAPLPRSRTPCPEVPHLSILLHARVPEAPVVSMPKTIQVKDIDETLVLDMIRKGCEEHSIGAFTWDIAEELALPERLVRAKLATMKRKGLIDGCDGCSCRGDWTIVEAG